MKRLTHINGSPLPSVFPGPVTGEPWVKLVSCEDEVQAKQTITDLPGGHGGIQGTPLRDVRRFTIRWAINGRRTDMGEPVRVLKRVFRPGDSSSDTVILGFTDFNFPGAGPHWTIAAMVTDLQFRETGRQSSVECQALLTAADPDFVGRSYAYTLEEGYRILGRSYDKEHPYAYGQSEYVHSKTVFLEGNVASEPSATITGPAVNPKLLNVTTGDYLLIEATLGALDVVNIASDGTVKLNGQYRNSLRQVGTRMPTLKPGTNEIVLVDDTSPLTGVPGPTATFSYTTRDA